MVLRKRLGNWNLFLVVITPINLKPFINIKVVEVLGVELD
jgi:hypothetical protein